jgi:hypothetical protein
MLSNPVSIAPGRYTQAEISKFLKSTKEQIERFKELKNYSPKLLSFRKQLNAEGIKCTFHMYTILQLKFASPVDGFEIPGQLKEINSQDVILFSPCLTYTILFEDCNTGIDLANRMRKAKLLFYPIPLPIKPQADNSNYSHGGDWL